jgi:hypothetical protein
LSLPGTRIWFPLLALLAYGLLAAVLLWPAGPGGEVLSACGPFVGTGPFAAQVRAAAPAGTPILGDPMQTFEPWQRYAADAFARTGSLPLWKDSNQCGAPLLGNAQSALFWPPNLLAVLLGAPAAALAWIALLKFAVAGLGTFLLARHLRVSWLGAFLAGLVYAFGGFQVLYAQFPLSNVSVLLPWLALTADRAALRPGGRTLAAVALVAALQHVGGHPETALHCQAGAALLVLVRAASLAGGVGRALRSRALLFPAAGMALGFAAAAIQVLPFLEYLRQSEALRERGREAWTFARVVPGAESLLVPPALAAAWFCARRLARPAARALPAAAGLLLACTVLLVAARHDGLFLDPVLILAPDWFGAHDAYLGYANYVFVNGGYAGAALVLAALGMLAGAPRAIARAGGALFVLALLLAHGVPVLTGLLESLPVFDVSANGRLHLLALLAAAVLAGLGLDALGVAAADAARARDLRRRWALLLGVPVLAVLVALPVSIVRGQHQFREARDAVRDARPMPAAALGSESLGVGRTIVAGWIAPGAAVQHALLLHGRGLSTPATLIPVPDDQRARQPELAAVAGPVYGFRAEVAREAGLDDAPYRVLCAGPDGAPWLSPLLGMPAGFPTWLFLAAAPEGPKSVGEIAFLVAAALLTAAALGARGTALACARAALVLLVCASLFHFGRGFLPSVPPALAYPPSPFLDALAELRPDGRHLVAHGSTFLLRPETGAAYGLMEPVGYDAMGVARYVPVLRAATDDPLLPKPMTDLPGRPDVDRRLLGLMAVRAFAHSADLPVPGETLHHDADGFTLTANERFLPRARVVPRAAVEADDTRALALLRDPSFDPATTVLLAAQPPASAAAGARPAPARITTDSPDTLVIDVSGNAGGYLVLADTFFPGWIAAVDGAEREILRANIAFRAVSVRPGERSVTFVYRPASFRAGAIVSALALLCMLGLSVGGARRRG